ncbi:hypothetical protein [Pontibacter sp. G13]|uniref:hypothetical protein n=1 Tax=Pontibacter sp. G13 TaxID=3074898 RepID=UPI00288BA9E4|nr:hypothetical protein [Pontibacter sp. G13]WNJ16563.1 hypothetical protein RJD25_16985 [Pontibacter sp. G13]
MLRTLLLGLMLIAGFGFVQAQAPQNMMEKKASFYAEEAAKEFGLKKKQKQKVYELKLAQMEANREVTKRKKAGEFADDAAVKAARQAAQKPIVADLIDVIGVPKKEFYAFNKRVNQELQKLNK